MRSGTAGTAETTRTAGTTWLRLAVSAVLIAWILGRAPLKEILAAFRAADLRFVLLAMAINPLAYLASVRRWRLLIRAQGGDAPLSYLLGSFLTGVFFNNLLPSTIGGDAVRALDTASTGVGKVKGAAIILVDRFVGLLALMLFATVGLLVSGRLTARVPALYAWVIGGATILVILAGLLFLPSAKSRLAELVAFRGKGSVLARAFAWSLLLQTQVVLNGYLLARALHVAVPLPYFFLIVPLTLFVMMLPVSINAIGVRESAWAFFLAPFGVPAATAVAVAWLDYGLLLVQAGVGAIVYLRRCRSGGPTCPPYASSVVARLDGGHVGPPLRTIPGVVSEEVIP
jgi:glycosyltransferase 2 family protein